MNTRWQGKERYARTLTATRFLASASQELNSSLMLGDVLRKIAQQVAEVVDCHLFCVMLWNEERQVLEHSYSIRHGEHVDASDEEPFPLERGITGAAARLAQPIRVGDITRDPRYVRFRHAEVEIRSELAVPLLCRNGLVGVLDLESTEPDVFTREHEEMLVALASHMATALENARLYEQMLSLEERRRRELATARQIQVGLLPEETPRIEGFEIGVALAPARELAGDFYDILPYADGRIAAVVGDVAGKATPAALYGSLAVGIMRGHIMGHPFTPGEMLGHLNDHLRLLHADYRFLAMSYALIDPRGRTLTLAGAGFPWPRLVRRGRLETVEVSGFPLGLFPDAVYRERTIRLDPDDVVVLFSDGLEDCLYEEGEQLADRVVNSWIRKLAGRGAQDIADELIRVSEPAAVVRERDGRESRRKPADDRTVVVIRAC